MNKYITHPEKCKSTNIKIYICFCIYLHFFFFCSLITMLNTSVYEENIIKMGVVPNDPYSYYNQ